MRLKVRQGDLLACVETMAALAQAKQSTWMNALRGADAKQPLQALPGTMVWLDQHASNMARAWLDEWNRRRDWNGTRAVREAPVSGLLSYTPGATGFMGVLDLDEHACWRARAAALDPLLVAIADALSPFWRALHPEVGQDLLDPEHPLWQAPDPRRLLTARGFVS